MLMLERNCISDRVSAVVDATKRDFPILKVLPIAGVIGVHIVHPEGNFGTRTRGGLTIDL